jgi:hypothetical protein
LGTCCIKSNATTATTAHVAQALNDFQTNYSILSVLCTF